MKISEQKKIFPCKINGVEIEKATTSDLLSSKIFYLFHIPLAFLTSLTLLFIKYNFGETLNPDNNLYLFAILILIGAILSVRNLTNVIRELKTREISAEDKNIANKNSKKNIATLVIIWTLIIVFVICLSSKSNPKPKRKPSSSSSSGSSYGAGGYEMPNDSDDSFADYVQRVDPDLYNAMNNRYNEAVGK